MIRGWWSVIFVVLMLYGCGSPRPDVRTPGPVSPPPIVVPPAPASPKATGDTLADALAQAEWRLGQAEAAKAQAAIEIKTLREEQNRDRQAAYERWLYGLAISTFVGAGVCLGLAFFLSAAAKPLCGLAAAFIAVGVLCLTAASLLPYLIWVAVAGGAMLIGLLAWLLFRTDGAFHRLTKGVDAWSTKAPEAAAGLLGTLSGALDSADKVLVRKHRARRQPQASVAGPPNPLS